MTQQHKRIKVVRWAAILLVALVGVMLTASEAMAQNAPFNVQLSFDSGEENARMSGVIQILVFMTIMTLLPSLLLTMTCFTRIIIVLSFVRRAMSLQQMPPNQVLLGLSLFLTVFVMSPAIDRLNREVLQPYMSQDISQKEALSKAMLVMRQFMIKNTREKDLALFVKISKRERPKSLKEIPTSVVVPAFVTSELRIAFQMGFVIFIPFLVIDMVVASVLTSMGMFMLPPIVISVPFKIVLFVLVDGWHLVVRSLAMSFL